MKKYLSLFLALAILFSLCACGSSITAGESAQLTDSEESETMNDDAESDASEETAEFLSEVELTVDNWDEYFELDHELSIVKNGFGEWKETDVENHLRLKEEYASRFVKSDSVAFEVNATCSSFHYEVNPTDGSCTISPIEPSYVQKNIIVEHVLHHRERETGSDPFFSVMFWNAGIGFHSENFNDEDTAGDYIADPNANVMYITDVEVIRAAGTLYFN